jgi:uncharacterized membrane protein
MAIGFPRLATLFLCALAVPGCGATGGTGPDARETTAFAGIALGETITLSGTEPFWSAQIEGDRMRYRTLEDQDGVEFPVERFAGNNGLSFSGRLPREGERTSGAAVDVAITPGDCSDGMSDRTYPFVATLVVANETLIGCAHTDRQPFQGPQHP